ncbi:MAG: redoxin domain-containing protein, partial [Burkholderiaceae bacterium]|nr:redoxin domain-containing protein [Burkholderiaceae bacterium]
MSESTVTLNEPVSDFNLDTADGVITLSAYKGKMLVLYFYPRDNTPGCTQESIDFRDARDQFAKLG